MLTKRVALSLSLIIYLIACFSYAQARQLNDLVLDKKKEGWYPAGVPMIRYNSDDGFGYGLRAAIYNNGNAGDRYYKFSPYFHMLSIQIFQTTLGKKEFMLKTDMPYFRGSRLRLFSSIRYAEELNAGFYGTGPDAMDLRGSDGIRYSDYAQYKRKFLLGYGSGGEYYKYNKYSIKRPDIDLYGYYEIFDDIKLMAGIRVRYTEVTPWGGRSFDIDDNDEDVHITDLVSAPTLIEELGIQDQDGWINAIKAGIGYDTRDYEPDPRDGIFGDATVFAATGAAGSDYDYIRLTACVRYYATAFRDLTLALRTAFTTVSGEVPFHEMGTFTFLTEDQSALGNNRTLRGYRANRFVGRTMTNANAEARWECVDFTAVGQHFALKIIGFMDTGRVFDNWKDPIDTWDNYRVGYGGGLVVTWNQAFIIHFYAGFSIEDNSISIDMQHAI